MEDPNELYAAYPRTIGNNYGSVDKLRSLSNGYFGLYRVFLVNIALAIVLDRLHAWDLQTRFFTVPLLLASVSIGLLSYPKMKQLGYALGWGRFEPALASAFLGLHSIFCLGLISYAIIQLSASSELKRYGIQKEFFVYRKKSVDEAMKAMRELRSNPSGVPDKT